MLFIRYLCLALQEERPIDRARDVVGVQGVPVRQQTMMSVRDQKSIHAPTIIYIKCRQVVAIELLSGETRKTSYLFLDDHHFSIPSRVSCVGITISTATTTARKCLACWSSSSTTSIDMTLRQPVSERPGRLSLSLRLPLALA